MTSQKTVVVAMSGGVDSSVAAYLLQKQGFSVIGVMLKLWSEKNASENRCCSSQSLEDAKKTADHLNIPFYILDYKDVFKQTIVDPFLAEYQQARTPNPCLSCNQKIRFSYLFDQARKFGADFFATGHYAILRQEQGFPALFAARDAKKDQSYMLHRISTEAKQRTLFPLGPYLKEEVRAFAKEAGLPTARKKESQDLCFLGDDGIKGFLSRKLPELFQPGLVKDLSGRVLGQHQGLHHYTLGQRKGLGLSLNEPHFVGRLDPKENCVYLAKNGELGWKVIYAVNFHFAVSDDASSKLDFPYDCAVKLRYHAPSLPARLIAVERGIAQIELGEKTFPITPGQGAVLYQGDRVLGGGFIRLPEDEQQLQTPKAPEELRLQKTA